MRRPHQIPSDVCGDIFLRLPAICLIRARAVCKSWRALIDDPSFVKAYTDKQLSSNTLLLRNSTDFSPLFSFDLDTLDPNDKGLQTISANPLGPNPSGLLPDLPVAACNGLFLVRPSEENWEIWNPSTDERLGLPDGDFVSPSAVAWGLGYDSASDDYKAVVITRQSVEGQLIYVYPTYVYSLKSDSWRKAAMNCPCDDRYWVSSNDSGVYLSGALHWMTSGMGFAFDLGTEKYRQWPLPPFRESEEIMIGDYHLVVLGGRLAVSDYGKDDYGSKHYDVWVMEDYGVEDSWFKLISMDPDLICRLYDDIIDCGFRPVACLKNKTQKKIFMQGGDGFCLFDVKSLSVKEVGFVGLTGRTQAQTFHESIFRLHDNCGVSGRVLIKTQRTRIASMLRKISDQTEYKRRRRRRRRRGRRSFT